MSLQESSERLATELPRELLKMMEEATAKAEGQKDLVTWIKKNFYIPETKNDPVLKGRIGLQPYQEDALREALSKDKNGNYKYSIIVWSDIKKSIKSTIAAAVNLARAWHTEWGEYYVIANDLNQANSRVAQYLRRAVLINPAMKKQVKMAGYKIAIPNGSLIQAIPIDPSGEAGSNADQLTWSELWGSNEDAKQNMWAEMTLSPTKAGQSFRWIESYAGFAGESLLLYSLWELGVKNGTMLWPEKLYDVTEGEPSPLELYVNPEAGMLCLWNTQPRCPWQTKAYYASESSILPPNQFLRIHRNQWVSSTESFVPMEWFDACNMKDQYPNIPKNHSMVIGLDAAVSGDSFAIWMGCRHPGDSKIVLTMLVKVWQPKSGVKLDYTGTEENPGPELFLRKLVKDYNVVCVAYDPYEMHYFTQTLNKEGLAWFKAFSQGTDRLLADSQIRDLIRERKLWHRGEKELRDHTQNADAKVDPEGRKVRIVKRTESQKVDSLVAASMGSYMVLYLNLA